MSDLRILGDILMVDDNPADVRLTREMFEGADMETRIHAASTGEDALDYLHQRGDHADAPYPDLILLDWHLPQMEGDEILRELKDDGDLRDIPVVVLSGSDAELDIVEDEVGPQADEYVPKPIEPETCFDIVERAERR